MAKILIIDDDAQIRSLVTKIMEIAGHEVVCAEDGVDGMKFFKGDSFDLVITDIIMPHKEGLETIVELKEYNPDIPIVAMSGGGRVEPDDYLKLAKIRGASVILKKPVEGSMLVTIVEELLAKE
ncbi:MAG: response regulator [Candidatus Hydrogenedentota bacterium]|nr:MAG: response regulator [Candidatus Hydrogenedentota bacterium]